MVLCTYMTCMQDTAGGGLVFWHPKGSVVRRCIEDYWQLKHTQVPSYYHPTLLTTHLTPAFYCTRATVLGRVRHSAYSTYG